MPFNDIVRAGTDPRLLLLDDRDNVFVAKARIRAGETISVSGEAILVPADLPLGHKLARHAIVKGEKIVKYGAPIGSATADIAHRRACPCAQCEERLHADLSPRRREDPIRERGVTMRGYLRADGRKGIRNIVVVGYLVECAHHVAREIALPFRDRDVHVIGFPGCYPNSYAEQMMDRLCTHPNVGAVLLVSLGCESFNKYRLAHAVRESGRPVQTIVIQAAGGTRKSIAEGQAFIAEQRAALDADGDRADGGRRADRRHGLRRLRRHLGHHRQSRRRAAPSTCWSTTAPPASSRRPAS